MFENRQKSHLPAKADSKEIKILTMGNKKHSEVRNKAKLYIQSNSVSSSWGPNKLCRYKRGVCRYKRGVW